MVMKTKDTVFTTILAVLLAPYLTRLGVPPTSPEYPVLIGSIVGAAPIAYHAVSSIAERVMARYFPPPPASAMSAAQLAQIIDELQRLQLLPAPQSTQQGIQK